MHVNKAWTPKYLATRWIKENANLHLQSNTERTTSILYPLLISIVSIHQKTIPLPCRHTFRHICYKARLLIHLILCNRYNNRILGYKASITSFPVYRCIVGSQIREIPSITQMKTGKGVTEQIDFLPICQSGNVQLKSWTTNIHNYSIKLLGRRQLNSPRLF